MMAGVWQTKDKNGRPHTLWRYWFIDWEGKRRSGTGTTSKTNTLKAARKKEEEHREIKMGMRPRPQLAKSQPKRFSDICQEYLDWGASQGGRAGHPWGEKHFASRKRHLQWWQKKLGMVLVPDLMGSLPQVEKALRVLEKEGKEKKTLANYAESICALCDWCVERDYLAEDPLKRLKRFDTTPQVRRRALTAAEIRALIAVAPPERKLVYGLACVTGLRAKELTSLTVGHVDFARGGLVLEAVWTKNRKPGFQPLPAALATLLQEMCAGISKNVSLLLVPSHPARSLDIDLAAAGIPKWTDEGKVDFHSLRNAFTTLVIESGANVKEAQSLLRHSTPELTMNVYARARSERLGELANKVGEHLGYIQECKTDVKRRNLGLGPNGITNVGAMGYASEKMVEAAGIEPASGSASTCASTCIARPLGFAGLGRVGRASQLR